MEDFTKEIATATQLKDEGNKFFKQGNYESAKNSYINSRQLIQKYHLVNQCKDLIITLESNIAMAYIKLENYEQAIEYADFAIHKLANNPKAYYRRGIANKNLKNYEKALSDLNTSFNQSKDPATKKEIEELELEIEKANPLPRALSFFEEGKKKLALKHFTKSQEDFNKASDLLKKQSGEEVESLKNSIHQQQLLMEVELFYEQGQYQKCITICDQLLEKQPNFFNALYRKGQSMDKVGASVKQTIKTLEQALHNAPTHDKQKEIERTIEGIRQQNE